MSLYSDASLAMIPSAVKDGKLYSIRPSDGSGDFTFSRGSNLAATRVDVNGLIEKGRENLLLQSNQFDTTWTNTNSTETSGQSGYDGSSDAWLLEKNDVNGRVNQSVSTSGIQTFSAYVKANVNQWAALFFTGPNSGKFFNLSNGTIGSDFLASPLDASIESVGNGWYRISITINASVNEVRIYTADADGVTSGTSGSIYIQDAQLEVGLVATDYIESTTTTAVSGITEDLPRLDYSGGASCPSLLLEPTRTNILPHSEYFNSFSIKSNISVTENAIISPDGTQNASKLIPDSTNTANHYIRTDISVSNATEYVISFFAKKGEYNYVNTYTSAYSSSTSATWNLNSGEVVLGSPNAEIEDYGNGWYRCIWKGTTNTTSLSYRIYVSELEDRNVSFSGDGIKGAYVWGAMFEQASYQSSYIPTYGSAVTRSGDFNDINDLIDTPYVFEDNDNFTFMYEGSFFDDGSSNMICGGGSASLGSTGKSYWWSQNYVNRIRLYGDGELLMASANYTFPSVNTNGKYLVRKADGVIDFFVNGTKLTTTQVYTNLRFDLRSAFWSYNPSVYTISGKAKQFLVFETALTDSEAIALTTL